MLLLLLMLMMLLNLLMLLMYLLLRLDLRLNWSLLLVHLSNLLLLLLLISDILLLVLLLHLVLYLLYVWLALMLDILLRLRLRLSLLSLLLRDPPVLRNLFNLDRFRSGHRLGRLLEGIIDHEVWVLLSQDSLNNFVSHPVVSDQSLSGVLGHIVTTLEGTLVGLVGAKGDVLQQLLLQMLVTHVLPESVSG